MKLTSNKWLCLSKLVAVWVLGFFLFFGFWLLFFSSFGNVMRDTMSENTESVFCHTECHISLRVN